MIVMGHYAVIGAPGEDVFNSVGTKIIGAGVVYVVDINTGAFVNLGATIGAIPNPNPTLNGQFGATLSGQGRVAIVSNALTGGGNFTMVDILSGKVITNLGGGLGSAIDGDRVAVFAASNNVYLYHFDGVSTSLTSVLTNPTPSTSGSYDLFGYNITLLPGDLVAVSAPTANVTQGAQTYVNSGKVFLFNTRDASVRTIVAPSANLSIGFGWSLSTVGDRLLIGQLGVSAGQNVHAYLYDIATGTFLQTFTYPTTTVSSFQPVTAAGTHAVVPFTFPSGLSTVFLYDASGIDSLASLSSLSQLQTLSAAHNHVSTLPNLSGWDSLSNLYLSDNRLSDISTLTNSTDTLANVDLRLNPLNNNAFQLNLPPGSITPNNAPTLATVGPKSTPNGTPIQIPLTVTDSDAGDHSLITVTGTGTSPGAIAWWRGENNANDSAGTFNGTLVGGASYAPGRTAGQAFKFNGSTAYVSIPSNAALDPTAAATLQAWVRMDRTPSAAGHFMAILTKSFSAKDFDLEAETDNKFHFYVADGRSVVSTTTIQAGQWYHVAATYVAGDRIEIYVNGVLEATTFIPGVTRQTNTTPFAIGTSAYWGNRYFEGLIDEPAVANRALTSAEIQTAMNANEEVTSTLSPTNVLTLTPAFGYVGNKPITVTVSDGPAATGDWRGRTATETFDFGAGVSGIYGTRFRDLNFNGVQDPGEAAIAGATLYIDSNNNRQFDPGEPTTTTDASGHYAFKNLPTSTYRVGAILQPNEYQSTPFGGAGPVGPYGTTTLFSADFASDDFTAPSLDGFTIDNSPVATGAADGLWHVSQENVGFGNYKLFYGREDANNFATDYDTPGQRNGGSVTSPVISLPSQGSLFLSFKYSLQTEGNAAIGKDVVNIQVSSDGGDFQTILSNADSSLFEIFYNFGAADLSAYAGHDVQIRFTFDTGDAEDNAHFGWALEDLSITQSFGTGPATRTANLSPGFPASGYDFGVATFLDLGPDVNVTEGTLVAPAPFIALPDTFDYFWHVTNAQGQTVDDSTIETFAFVPTDNGIYTLSLTLYDRTRNARFSDSMTITASNTAPSAVDIGGDRNVAEGTPLTFTPSFIDFGLSFTHAWTLKNSTSQVIAQSSNSTFSFTPPNQGIYTLTYTVTDSDGASSDPVSVTITATNAAPQNVSAGSNRTVTEGTPVTFSGTFTDPGAGDSHTYLWSVSASNGQIIATGTSQNYGFIPLDNGQYIVTFTVTDDSGDSASAQSVVTVTNVAPQNVNAGPDRSVPEGSIVNLPGAFTDPGAADTQTYRWHVVASNGQVIADGTGHDFSFTPADNGIFTVTYTVTDDDDGSSSDTAIITATNVAPQNVSAGADITVSEGQSVTLHGTYNDPGADTHTYRWHVADDNGQVIADGNAIDFTFTPVDQGAYTITFTVNDDDSAASSGIVHVTATNAAPQAAITGGDRTSIEGQPVSFQGTWTDAGINDTHTYNWRVASTNGQVIADGTGQAFAFTPINNGVYSVTYTVTDNFGDATSARVTLNVANAAPAVSAFSGPATAQTGTVAHFFGAFADVQADFSGMRGTINFSDGVTLPLALNPDGTFSIDRIFAAAGPQAAALTITDPDGASATRLVNLSVTPPSVPHVTTAAILRDLTPLSIKLTFNADLSASISAAGGAAALKIKNLTSGLSIPATAYTYTWDTSTNSATFRFLAPPALGNYTATLDATKITTASGTHLDGNNDGVTGDNYVLNFYNLPGDFNLDRAVNFADLVAVAQNYGRSVTQYAKGDANGDGIVGFADLVAVAQNYGKTLPAPAPLPATLPPESPAIQPANSSPEPEAITAPVVKKPISPTTVTVTPPTTITKPVARSRKAAPAPIVKSAAAKPVENPPLPAKPAVFGDRRINQNDLLK